MSATSADAVLVVVPANDEQELLPDCLSALRAAVAHPGVRVPVQLVVVADACRDGTEAVGRAAGAAVVRVGWGNVGAARRAGVDAGRSMLGRVRADRLWCLTTDADSRVPRDWVARQLGRAAQGWDAVVGTVQVRDWTGHRPATRRAWRRSYTVAARGTGPDGEGHPHVHGANLGVRASAYDEVGGFPELPAHEDRILVQRLRAAGLRVLATTECPVDTSARTWSRTREGFAAHLRRLAEDIG